MKVPIRCTEGIDLLIKMCSQGAQLQLGTPSILESQNLAETLNFAQCVV